MSVHFVFPKPRDSELFEDIVADVFARKYQCQNLQRYGRSGQKQYGVDVVGFVGKELIGIQCKNHPETKIKISEIDAEIVKAESFSPPLAEFVIATSAKRDTETHAYVLSLSAEREKAGKFPVGIKFWEDIVNWLSEYKDLTYKHFTQYFPVNEFVDIAYPTNVVRFQSTLDWPFSSHDLQTYTEQALQQIDRVDPFRIVLGVSTFDDVSFQQKTNANLPLADLFSDKSIVESNFQECAQRLASLKQTLSSYDIDKNLTIHLQARLSVAFLLGWTFRRVTAFKLTLLHRESVWSTQGLPHVRSGLVETKPSFINPNSSEAVLILNITRNINASVVDYVDSWLSQPQIILGYRLDGAVQSSAHALSIAEEIAIKIKALSDEWRIERLHLFAVMPAALATLIAHNLNSVCPISFYYLAQKPSDYRIAGTIDRNT